MNRRTATFLVFAVALFLFATADSFSATESKILRPSQPLSRAALGDVQGVWLTDGRIISVDVVAQRNTEAKGEATTSKFRLVGPSGDQPLGELEGFGVRRIRALRSVAGHERIEVAGSALQTNGEYQFATRVLEVGTPGGVRTVWDSRQLPLEQGSEPVVRVDRNGEFWVAAVTTIRTGVMVGARVLAGEVGSVAPRWTATIDLQEAAWTANAPTLDLDVAFLRSDLAAVLLRGRVFLVGPPGTKIARPVLRPTLGRGRMLFADPEAQLLMVYEEGTDALSCFQFDGEEAPTGVAAPDFVLDEKTIGVSMAAPIGATSEGIVLAGTGHGSSKQYLLTVSMSHRGGVRVLDRRVLPVSGTIDDITIAADGGTVEWTERGHDRSQTLHRSTIASLAH